MTKSRIVQVWPYNCHTASIDVYANVYVSLLQSGAKTDCDRCQLADEYQSRPDSLPRGAGSIRRGAKERPQSVLPTNPYGSQS